MLIAVNFRVAGVVLGARLTDGQGFGGKGRIRRERKLRGAAGTRLMRAVDGSSVSLFRQGQVKETAWNAQDEPALVYVQKH